MLNTNTMLPCGYSGSDFAISWWANGVQLSNNEQVFPPYVNKYAQNWDPASGKADLIVMNTQDSDAVQYRCSLGQSAKEAYAQLVVLGKCNHRKIVIQDETCTKMGPVSLTTPDFSCLNMVNIDA